jgi:ubiquinone/menaquinone biosynthesis C-methylase UbiE
MEINLMANYPKSKRPIEDRYKLVTEEHKAIAREFGREYFDGSRLTGYGGYYYNPKYWTEVVRDMISYYNVTEGGRVLDLGAGKAFMIYDMVRQYPDLEVRGIDISQYALDNAKEEVRCLLELGTADDIHYPDKYFDLVICINTIHNLPRDRCATALREIERVGRRAFVVVDAWRDQEGRELMVKWNLTALTYMSTEDWVQFFEECGYSGDYYWFLPGG